MNRKVHCIHRKVHCIHRKVHCIHRKVHCIHRKVHCIQWNRRDWAILIGLTLLAALLRFYKLGVIPPGFQFDEAYNALDAAGVLEGQRPLFLPLNGGREVLYTYLQAGLASLFGLSVYTLRLTSALAGIAAIPASYVLLRCLLQRHARRIAALTSLALAISFWHLHFSHYGIRVILMPVLFSGVCGFFWLGARRLQAWPYVIGGLLTGLSVWAHPTGRLIPLVLIAYTLWLLWQHPETGKYTVSMRHWIGGGRETTPLQEGRSPAGPEGAGRTRRVYPPLGLLLAGSAALLVFLPLGLEFYRHPDFFLGHAGLVSVFAPRVSQGSPLLALLRNAGAVLGMFSIRGDSAWIHNLMGRPIFDPLLSIPFWLGLVLWIVRLLRRDDPDRDSLALLMLWSLVMLLPTVFSDDAPNFSRSLPALPAVFVAVGLGLSAIADLLARAPMPAKAARAAGVAVIGLIVIGSLVLAARDYFVRFPKAPEAYYAYDVDKLDAWAHLRPLAAAHQVYLSQLWAEHATLAFLRRGTDVKSFDSSETVVLPPSGRGAVYAFPALQRQRAVRLATLWPGTPVQEFSDAHGAPLLETVTLDPETLRDYPPARSPEKPLEVAFNGGPTLLGMRPDGSDVLLFWRGEALMPRNLTAFVHLLGADGSRVGQVDQVPGDGSFPTPSWSAGERVIERYRPAFEPCRDEAPARVLTGWYDLAAGGARLPRADGAGEMALAGEYSPPLASHPLDDMQPAQRIAVKVGPELTLAGYTLDGPDLQPGSLLVLDLYWQGDPAAAGKSLSVVLLLAPASPDATSLPAGDQAGAVALWQGPAVPASAIWRPGEAICRRLRLRAPANAQSGRYHLALQPMGAAGQGATLTIDLGEIVLGPSKRRYDLPPLARATNARLGDAVRLAGADVTSAGPSGPITVTLVWQSTAAVATSQTVFVHLLDEDGKIVAQSDALPNAGDPNISYPTDRWAPGEVVTDVHVLALPPATGAQQPARYRLVAGMYDPLTNTRLPARDEGGLAIRDDAVPLGDVELR